MANQCDTKVLISDIARQIVKGTDKAVKHSQALNMIAKGLGYDDWCSLKPLVESGEYELNVNKEINGNCW